MELIYKIQRFMDGRYGIDELSNFLFKIYIALVILNIFIDNYLISILELIIIIIMIYRTLSKNINKRKQENIKFIKVKKQIIKPFISIKKNISDKEYIYRKCNGCKKVLKLPIPFERGIKHVKCPNCKKKITTLVLKKQKVEIIK